MTPTDHAVRVTVHPAEDVLLRPGASVRDLRAPLAELLRRPELRHAPLSVDGEPLSDDAAAGDRPLLPGAVLRTGPAAPGRDPLRAPWLVTRTTGADAGVVVGTPTLRAALRAWTRLRPAGRAALRRAHGPAAWLAPRPQAGRGPAPWVYAALPAVASLGLAVALRQPLLLVFALLGAVVAAPQLRAAGSGARARGPRPLPGPAALLTWAHAASNVSAGAWATAREAWARSGGLAAGAVAGAAGPFAVPPGPGAHLRAPADGDPWEQLLHDGAVAVLGPAAEAAAVARALVVRLAVRGAEVGVAGGSGDADWRWTRWVPRGGPRVRVHPRGGGGDRTADLVLTVGTVPAGCRAVVRVLDGRTVRITGPDGTTCVVPLVGVGAAWAEQLARLLAGAARLGRGTGPREDAGLPAVVALTTAHGLDRVPGPAQLAARWAAAAGWAVPLGTGAGGAPVLLDLVRDGPHLLVAGTTGAGKSELLQALLLGLALTRSPADLALVLVDFKGGASLGPCPGLPHVVGRVTDLDPGLAARALAGVRAELRRRERVLADHGAPDVDALPSGTLPRLVVVIDEFRALTDDLPELLPGLLRTAAQGRSLGVHLVLATQRPGGAVGPDLRANVGARVALRVTDPAESRDVVDDPAAARIPAATPGRALLRVGSAPPVPLQCAHPAAPVPAVVPLVRRAPSGGPRPAATVPPAVGRVATAGTGARPPADPPGTADLLVAAARDAARQTGHVPGDPPWLPALPTRATTADLPPPRRRDRRGLVVALGDDPDGRRRTTVTWDTGDGHLAVLGGARSGRTTALLTIALAALDRGWSVHAVTRDAAGLAALRGRPGCRGCLRPEEAVALPGLLAEEGGGAGGPVLVVVDGAEDLAGALPQAALRSGAAFAVAAGSASVGGLAAGIGPRLVLLGTDRAADVVLGAPASHAGTGGPPGRAVWCGRREPVLCQVLEPRLSPSSASETSPRPPTAS
ncbi:MAG TPA: FtsK/SpoIIIE domain-containing protein [Pseudonocardia sp.]|uniref:FtsK/SpoIIIE domain-containing protein n=1 Tax=Pseudonocardia sp. TaxID=60912 RepID=UPI002B4AF2E3|nr:FtsK/SpoIIIE domain-containing protein [Pseudonocardia sp.]HLU57804.1 FtsK/SpoIIIE domain-containing protein [Pseudonocardia sp.]